MSATPSDLAMRLQNVAAGLSASVSKLLYFWSLGLGMRYYTDHGSEHSTRVESFFTQLLTDSPNLLNDVEEEIIRIAVFTHDIGCIVSREAHANLTYTALNGLWGQEYYLKLATSEDERHALQLAARICYSHGSDLFPDLDRSPSFAADCHTEFLPV